MFTKIETECQQKGCDFSTQLEVRLEVPITLDDAYKHALETGHLVGFYGTVSREA